MARVGDRLDAGLAADHEFTKPLCHISIGFWIADGSNGGRFDILESRYGSPVVD